MICESSLEVEMFLTQVLHTYQEHSGVTIHPRKGVAPCSQPLVELCSQSHFLALRIHESFQAFGFSLVACERNLSAKQALLDTKVKA